MAFAKNVYYFNASAVAVAARWRRPFDESGQIGAVQVSSVGGSFSSSSKERMQLAKGLVSVDAFETRASSDYTNPVAARLFTESAGAKPNRWSEINLPISTVVSCKAKGFEVANKDRETGKSRILRIERIDFESKSSRKPKGELTHSDLSLDFAGVKIDGKALNISIDNAVFTKCSTHKKLCKAKLGNRAHPANNGERMVATVVNKITWVGESIPDVKIDGHCVTVPGFGTIYFGEVISSANHRRVIPVRMALGSPDGAQVELGGGGGSNGHGAP